MKETAMTSTQTTQIQHDRACPVSYSRSKILTFKERYDGVWMGNDGMSLVPYGKDSLRLVIDGEHALTIEFRSLAQYDLKKYFNVFMVKMYSYFQRYGRQKDQKVKLNSGHFTKGTTFICRDSHCGLEGQTFTVKHLNYDPVESFIIVCEEKYDDSETYLSGKNIKIAAVHATDIIKRMPGNVTADSDFDQKTAKVKPIEHEKDVREVYTDFTFQTSLQRAQYLHRKGLVAFNTVEGALAVMNIFDKLYHNRYFFDVQKMIKLLKARGLVTGVNEVHKKGRIKALLFVDPVKARKLFESHPALISRKHKMESEIVSVKPQPRYHIDSFIRDELIYENI